MAIDSATTPSPASSWLTPHRRSTIARASLYLGAVAVSATGVDHVQQYYVDDYSTVPTIGTLFFLNFVSAVVITAGLIAPLRRLAGRHADAIRALFAVGGIGLGLLSLAALFVSESSGLFGFVEHGYRTPIALAIVAEAAAVVFLGIFLAATATGGHRELIDVLRFAADAAVVVASAEALSATLPGVGHAARYHCRRGREPACRAGS